MLGLSFSNACTSEITCCAEVIDKLILECIRLGGTNKHLKWEGALDVFDLNRQTITETVVSNPGYFDILVLCVYPPTIPNLQFCLCCMAASPTMAMGHRFWATGYGLWAMGHEQWIVNHGQGNGPWP